MVGPLELKPLQLTSKSRDESLSERCIKNGC